MKVIRNRKYEFQLDINNWKIIIETFNEYIEKEKNNNLAHDEETLISLFYNKYNFFKKLNNF